MFVVQPVYSAIPSAMNADAAAFDGLLFSSNVFCLHGIVGSRPCAGKSCRSKHRSCA